MSRTRAFINLSAENTDNNVSFLMETEEEMQKLMKENDIDIGNLAEDYIEFIADYPWDNWIELPITDKNADRMHKIAHALDAALNKQTLTLTFMSIGDKEEFKASLKMDKAQGARHIEMED